MVLNWHEELKRRVPTQLMPLQPGTTLGPYAVTAKIGEGGMGEVYRARDTKLDRDVALKVLPQAFTEDPDRLARFEREAKVLASLNHPGIAAIYGLEESDGQQALVSSNSSKDQRWPTASPKGQSPSTKPCPSRSRSPRRWKPHMKLASSTGI